MKKIYLVYTTIFICSAAFASTTLYQEFRRRENIRLTQEEGNVINFLKLMNYDTSKVEEMEVMEGGTFVIRDRDNIVCFGDQGERMLRCKNKIGLTTVTFDGDAD